MWVLFNEAQGYYDPARLSAATKLLDPSRLVSRNSGGEHGNDLGISDVRDAHSYPSPNYPAYNPAQVSVIGEYGGIGYVLKGHAFAGDDYKYFHYTDTPTPQSLQDQYGNFTERLRRFRDERGGLYPTHRRGNGDQRLDDL
ncbi:hypothetical protein IAD21_00264 [Abditibacteriota bacterium]|nr:hypothetical protein IAD21_00264 [Abditibacteriota bacterium]